MQECDDANSCTIDTCNGKNGCSHLPTNESLACGYGTCTKGVCTPNSAGCIEDGDVCGAGKGKCASGHCFWTDAIGYKWTLVPAGVFWMGCNAAVDKSCSGSGNETPQRKVVMSGYWIGVYTATATQYKTCLAAGFEGCTPPSTTTGTYATYATPEKAQHPANYLTWDQAQGFCKFVGGDLPSEAQWEKAARGGCDVYPGVNCATAEPLYPWGNTAPVCGQQAVFDDTNSGKTCGNALSTYAVGAGSAAGPSPYAAFDMAGNVWQWTLDGYFYGYFQGIGDSATDPLFGGSALGHTIRGGSFESGLAPLRSGNRTYGGTTGASAFGVRCAKPMK